MNDILSRFDKVKTIGHGRYKACCPAHPDTNPSLAITFLEDGRILMKCWAGCSVTNVLQSVGLAMSDLFPDGKISHYIKSFYIQEKEAEQRKSKNNLDKTVLEMAASWRRQGKRLSPKDLEREKQAYLRTRK